MKIDIVKGTIINTNNYIIGKDEVVLVEASAGLDKIKRVVKNKKVLAVLLTHGHWDHFYHLDKYIKEFGCKVYMTESAFEKINCREKTFVIDRNPKINISKKDVCFIKDCDVLDFGKGLIFKVIETKGHTDCSVSFLLNDTFLFSGDTLFKKDVGRYDLPTGNYQEILQSLKRLFELNENVIVYPGHGEPTTIGSEKEYCLF